MIQDVPSPIDLRLMSDACEWEATALSKRPSRPEFFAQFASSIKSATIPVHRILELGSGPGFLAEHLLHALPAVAYVAFDFSPAMHQLCLRATWFSRFACPVCTTQLPRIWLVGWLGEIRVRCHPSSSSRITSQALRQRIS